MSQVPRSVVWPSWIGFALALAATSASVTAMEAAENGATHAAWVAESGGVLKLAASDGSILLELQHEQPVRAVAIDSRRLRLWTFSGKRLRCFDLLGEPILDLETDLPNAEPALLEVDPLDGTVWLAMNDQLRGVSAAGVMLTSKRMAEQIVALDFDDGGERLWIATRSAVRALDPITASEILTLIQGEGEGIQDVSVEDDSTAIWVATSERVLRFDVQGAVLGEAWIPNSQVVAATAGGVWVATKKDVLRLDESGRMQFQLRPFGGRGTLRELVADPKDGSVWTSSHDEVAHLTTAGEVEALVALRPSLHVWDLTVYADVIPPILDIVAPLDGQSLAEKRPQIILRFEDIGAGVDLDSFAATANGTPLTLDCETTPGEANCVPLADLEEGVVDLLVSLSDRASNVTSEHVSLIIDTVPPPAPDVALIEISEPAAGRVEVTGSAGSVEAEARVVISNQRTGDVASVPAGADGSFSLRIDGAIGDRLALTLFDAVGNQSIVTELEVPGPISGPLPSDPAEVAPPLDLTVATDVAASTAFLYSGPNPIQAGVAPGTIEPSRAAVLRGRVLDTTGTPLPGVRVSIHGHPEYGSTLSRTDGVFDLAVNGGGELVLSYEKDGYLPADRRVAAGWRSYSWAEDVVLVQLDENVSSIRTEHSEVQVARGSEVNDADGARLATLVVPAGTAAQMTLADGSTQAVTALHLRLTEYTAGESGAQAMPGPLPATSGLTYAVELSADEAIASDAARVDFSRDVYLYVENFLDFPVGEVVPAGYYDRKVASWIPSQDGRVIEILDVEGGIAVVDIDGSGSAANDSALGLLGFTEGELKQLASLYPADQPLWRVPIPHLTPWDCNSPYGPPEDAEEPPDPGKRTADDDDDPDQDDDDGDSDDNEDEEPDEVDDPNDEPAPLEEEPCLQTGSIIECENQALGESLPIAGTNFALHYRTSNQPGFEVSRTVRVHLSGPEIPASLKRIDLRITIAGQRFQRSFHPEPDQETLFVWDGRDAYGREVNGYQNALVEVAYVYPLVYYSAFGSPRSFARMSVTRTPIAGTSRFEVTLWNRSIATVEAVAHTGYDLGGWTLTPHHRLDPYSRTLTLGDGTERRFADDSTIAAPDWSFSALAPDVESAADGSIYFLSGTFCFNCLDKLIRRSPSGHHTVLEEIHNRFGGISDFAVRPDGHYALVTGSCFPSTAGPPRVHHFQPDGTLVRSFLDRALGCPENSMTWGPEGSIFLVSRALFDEPRAARRQVLRLWPDGSVTVVAGTTEATSTDPSSAMTAIIDPDSLEIDRDGNIYFSEDHRIWKIDPTGFIDAFAGTGEQGFSGDGLAADEARLSFPTSMEAGLRGLAFVDHGNRRVRLVRPDGVIVTLAGGGSTPVSDRPLKPLDASLSVLGGLTELPDGSFSVVHANQFIGVGTVVLRLDQSLTIRGSSFLVPSPDSSEIYEFDGTGRHLRTLDSITGAARLSFGYDGEGRLENMTDAHGNATLVERSADGAPTAIVAPFGQRTDLEMSSSGYLASVKNPKGEAISLDYDPDGLLIERLDPLGHLHRYGYSSRGRLVSVLDPAGGRRSFERDRLAGGYEVVSSTASGHRITYRITREDDGSSRRTMIDPSGLATTAVADPNGVTTRATPLGVVTTFVRQPDPRFSLESPLPQLVATTLPSGLRSTSVFDRSVQLENENDPLSVQQVTETRKINGRIYRQTIFHDASTKTSTLTTPTGRSSLSVRDELGRLTRIETAGSHRVSVLYDPRGRLATVSQGAADDLRSLSFSYGSDGHLARITDPLSRTLMFEYDPAGRIVEQTLPGDRVVDFDYDANGNLIELAPPGRPAHRFEYDASNLVTRYSPPDLGAGPEDTNYEYDPDQNLTRVERPDGKAIDAEYMAGRLAALRSPDGDINYRYNPQTGQLDAIAGPGSIELAYDYDGHLLTATTWSGEVAGSISRHYDNDFRITTRCVNDGHCVSFSRDDDGLLTRAGDLTLTRDPITGRLASTSLGVITTTQTYTPFGELATYSASAQSAPIFEYRLSRDVAGRIVGKTETIQGVTTAWLYHFDPAGRLERVEKDDALFAQYTYDENGNRLSYQGAFGSALGLYDVQDRLVHYGDSLFAYTANGELLSRTEGVHSVAYGYDVYGNLRSVDFPDGLSIEYLVDGEHRRVGKRIEGTLVKAWLYKDQLNPVAELDGAGTVVARLVYASMPHVPDFILKGGSTYRVLTDHLGSVRMIVDAASGGVVQRSDYDEFGRVLLDTNPGFQPFGFAGGMYEQQTELIRFGARDYSPRVGRWTQKDRAGFEASELNLYGYVQGDPINLIDTTGLAGCNVAFPGFPITLPWADMRVPLNHAGVLAYDDQGNTRYYEYGRYRPGNHGRVRQQTVPNLEIGPDGEPTEASWEALEKALEDGPGRGYDPWITCREESDYDKIIKFAEERMRSPEKFPAYSWNPFNPNTCVTFAFDAVQAGLR